MEFHPLWYKPSRWFGWASRNKAVWIFFGVFFAVCLSVDWIGCNVGGTRIDRLPVSGWLLEIAGIGTALWGFSERLKLHLGSGFWDLAKGFFTDMPLFRNDQNVLVPHSTIQAQGSLNTRFDVAGQLNSTIEEQIALLEQQMRQLTQDLSELERAVTENIEAVEQRINSEINDIRRTVTDLRELVNESQVGGIGWEVVGITWIILGLTLATVPELVWWFANDLLPIVPILEIGLFSCVHA